MALTKVTYSMIETAPVNVLDYGADASGATDSSGAIQDAIDAANGRPVYLPAGTYKIQSTVTSYNVSGQTSNGVRIYGDGPALTVINNRVASGYCFDFDHSIGSTTYNNQVFSTGSYMRGLSILGDAGVANSSGIKLRGLYACHFDQIVIRDHTLYGLHADVDTAYNPDITATVRLMVSNSSISYNKIGVYAPQVQALPTCKFICTNVDWNTDIGVVMASNYFSMEDGSISFNGYSYSGDFTPSLSFGGFINPNIADGVPAGNRLVNVELDGNKPQQVYSAVSTNLLVSRCKFGVRLLDGETNKYMVVLGADVPAGVFSCYDPVVEHCAITVNAGDYAAVTAILYKFKAGSRLGYIGNNSYFITGTNLTAGTNLFYVSEDARSGGNSGTANGVKFEYQNAVTLPTAYVTQYRSSIVYVSMADDTAYSFTPTFDTAVFTVTAGSAFASALVGYALGVNSVYALATVGGGVNLTTGALNGTTGTDGRLNISADGGKLYFENRLGSAITLAVNIGPTTRVSP